MDLDYDTSKECGYQQQAEIFQLVIVLYFQLARLLVRHNLQVPALEKMFRWVIAQVAMNDPEFSIPGREHDQKQTFAHAAVITGMRRQDISSIFQQGKSPSSEATLELYRVIKVLTAWRTEPGYQYEEGHPCANEPIDLPLRGSRPSLHHLCRMYGRGTTTRAIADIIVRDGNAEWIGESEGNRQGKMLRYIHPVVTADNEESKNTAIFTQIGSDFLHSYQKMLDPDCTQRPRFREGYYNDISAHKVKEAIAELHEEIQKFNVRCTELLKKYRATEGESTVRIGAGSYSFYGAPLYLGENNSLEDDLLEKALNHIGGEQ